MSSVKDWFSQKLQLLGESTLMILSLLTLLLMQEPSGIETYIMQRPAPFCAEIKLYLEEWGLGVLNSWPLGHRVFDNMSKTNSP